MDGHGQPHHSVFDWAPANSVLSADPAPPHPTHETKAPQHMPPLPPSGPASAVAPELLAAARRQLGEKDLRLLELRGQVMVASEAVGARDRAIATLRKELDILRQSMPPSVVDTSVMKTLHRRVRTALSETGEMRQQTRRLEQELANKAARVAELASRLDESSAEGERRLRGLRVAEERIAQQGRELADAAAAARAREAAHTERDAEQSGLLEAAGERASELEAELAQGRAETDTVLSQLTDAQAGADHAVEVGVYAGGVCVSVSVCVCVCVLWNARTMENKS